MNNTKIEWCDKTINPVVGCTFNCEYCYARKMNNRFGWIEDFNKPVFFSERLKRLNSKKAQNIFMNSMSDVADWVGRNYTMDIFQAMADNPQHNYLFLTKRPQAYVDNVCMWEAYDGLNIDNVWFGTTITNDEQPFFFSDKHNTFLSIEPIHGDFVTFRQNEKIPTDWIIIGAETGNRKDKVIPKKEWIDNIVKVAKKDNIPVFMKDSLIKVVGEENMLREFPLSLLQHTRQRLI